MLRPLLSLALAAAFALPASAQCNANLAVSGGQAGTNLTFAITGAAPGATAFLLVSNTSTTATFSLAALGTLTILSPAVPVPLGMADLSGAVSLSIPIDASIPCTMLYGQGLTVGFDITSLPPTFSACETNIAGFSVGC